MKTLPDPTLATIRQRLREKPLKRRYDEVKKIRKKKTSNGKKECEVMKMKGRKRKRKRNQKGAKKKHWRWRKKRRRSEKRE